MFYYPVCDQQLRCLEVECRLVCQQLIFDQLLGERTAARAGFRATDFLQCRPEECFWDDTVMIIEILIFCSDECISDIRRDIIIIYTFTYQVRSQRSE